MATQVSKLAPAAESGEQTSHSGRGTVRNLVCGLLAVGLIVTGRVRRARKRALSGDVITAIYFHHPTKRLFAQCIRWLQKHHYTFISSSDLLETMQCGKPFPKGAVWLSFDDGCKELLDNVLPLAYQYKVPVTLFIPSGIVGGNGLFPWLHKGPERKQAVGRDSMTVQELQHVASRAEVTIGSHTVSHAHMPLCTETDLKRELLDSKRALESWVGYSVHTFSFPYGEFDGRERQCLADCGYKIAVTTVNEFVAPDLDLYRIPRFAVANDISYPEAICNMVGVWRPMLDAIKSRLGRGKVGA